MMTRPTLKDVARRASVSVSTVSYALNDDSHVHLAPETRARVRRIAKELGYTPNAMARSLRTRSSRTAGVVLTKPLTNLRYAAIVQGIANGLATSGLRMTVLPDATAGVLEDCRNGMIDGLIFVGHDDAVPPPALVEAAAVGVAPLVTIDCGGRAADAPHSAVDFDYAHGAREMITHLAGRDIRTILHVRPEVSSRAERDRQATLMRALGHADGVTMRVVSTGMSDEDLARTDAEDGAIARGYLASTLRSITDALLGVDDPDTTAVLCSWGADVETSLRAVSHVAPGTVVAALAGSWPRTEIWPDLVYSRLPLEEAGRRAAALLSSELAPDREHLSIVLPPALDTRLPETPPGRTPA
ncbi:hypothetical protein C1N80_04980 [Brachybacterium sp. SGAir0954]|nr:hypothetical protein C1N80_04980 [Brachybacterium sp. SGAir0954]